MANNTIAGIGLAVCAGVWTNALAITIQACAAVHAGNIFARIMIARGEK